MQRDYQNPELRELRDQQIRFAPRVKKLQQVEAAERLIAEIDSDKTYPYEYVCFRVTGYRPSEPAPSKIKGDDLRHDLQLFVEDLSDSADMAADNIGEQVLTVEELAKQFNVSTKTISRWRELGLVSRRLVFDGRKRVGFLRSSVDRFVKTNQERVARGARFSQLTDEQRQDIIERARRLATAGGKGIRFSVADVTVLVTVDFAVGAINFPVPDKHRSLKRWYEAISSRPSLAA